MDIIINVNIPSNGSLFTLALDSDEWFLGNIDHHFAVCCFVFKLVVTCKAMQF